MGRNQGDRELVEKDKTWDRVLLFFVVVALFGFVVCLFVWGFFD